MHACCRTRSFGANQIAMPAHAIQPITVLADQLGLAAEQLITYGKYKAKVQLPGFDEQKIGRAKLILVTSITPTKAGNGKTTCSIGMADGLRRLGHKAVLALREPSLGPCFGMKGGATGGGGSQLVPADEINLHFTGDFHAISAANNMLAALIDNYNYFRQGSPEELREIVWRRVLDVNDRSLRYIITGLHGGKNGLPAETGFDITPASELMAALCLSQDETDLRQRIDRMLLGTTAGGKPFTTADLQVSGAITALLRDALLPNLVQTLEGTPAFVHGGPFANIAHGCNSLIATKTAMELGDYVLTEAGFGSDLGAEKFMNIKCRLAGLTPALSTLVVTAQSLKLHGEVPYRSIREPNPAALLLGMRNLERHLDILHGFGQQVLVVVNRFDTDSAEEIALIRQWCEERYIACAVNEAFARGGEGAMEVAEKIVRMTEDAPTPLQLSYADEDSVEQKLHQVATRVYKADGVQLEKKARQKLRYIEANGWQHLPVCIAKTQYSFTDTPEAVHTYRDFNITVEDLIVNTGAGFIVAVCGDMMRMPGLPEHPAAEQINLVRGKIVGLS
jgi:formate--tetrahydrofolate ligase